MNGIASGVASAFARAAAPLPPPHPASPAPRHAWVRDPRHRLLLAGLASTLVVLMIVPDGFDYADLGAGAPTAGGSISRLLWLLLLGGGLFVIACRAGLAALLMRWINPFLLGFVVLALVSTAWSLEPEVTARRMVRVITILSVAIAFALAGWHSLRLQNLLRPILTGVLLGSIVFGLLRPDLAIQQVGSEELVGSWRGLASHKNGFGNIACIALIFWFHAWLTQAVRPSMALAGAALATLCLVLSRSSTSMVVAIFSLLFLLLLLRSPESLKRYMPYLVSLFVLALLGYALAILDVIPGLNFLLAPINALTGKDATFTGRTEIWDLVSTHIRLHPLLGSGYGAYWTGAREDADSYVFITSMRFYPGSAHSGYLDIVNDLGALGLIVLLGYLASFLWQSLRLMRFDRPQAALYLALFLQQAITNLSESRWLNVLSLDFVIMTLATAALARTLLDHRLHAYFGHPLHPRPPPAGGHAPPSPAVPITSA